MNRVTKRRYRKEVRGKWETPLSGLQTQLELANDELPAEYWQLVVRPRDAQA